MKKIKKNSLCSLLLIPVTTIFLGLLLINYLHPKPIYITIGISFVFFTTLAIITVMMKISIKFHQLEDENRELKNSRNSSLEYIDALWKSQQGFIQDEKLSSLNSLVSGVAHELNTPLGISLTALSYLEEIINSDEAAGIQENAAPMLNLTLSNLQKSISLVEKFKQIAADSSYDDIEQVEIEDFITFTCCRISSDLTINKKIKIVYNLPDDLVINISQMSLSIILKNILENAYEFAYPGQFEGIIEVSAQSIGNDLLLTIKDFGKGIPESDIKHIFDPFFTTKRAHKHYGLGLAISYNLLSRHYSGQIQCTSNNNSGTTFEITVPEVVCINNKVAVKN